MKVLHDKGIARLIGPLNVKKGDWYFGVLCKSCGGKIYLRENKNKSVEAPFVGDGLISVPCLTCKVDEDLYTTNKLVGFEVDADRTHSRAVPRATPTNGSRKTLLNRYPKAKATFGPQMIEERPDCAITIARCITSWSYIETEIAHLLSVVLKINTRAALAMFLAVQSSRMQYELLMAASRVELKENDFELLEAYMALKARYESERNDLAHGMFGISQLSDGIFWQSQINSVGHTAKVVSSDYKDINTGAEKNIFVYEPGELEAIAQRFSWIHQQLSFFRGYLGSENIAWREERYHQLCSEPQVRQELNRIRAGRKNTKRSPPR